MSDMQQTACFGYPPGDKITSQVLFSDVVTEAWKEACFLLGTCNEKLPVVMGLTSMRFMYPVISALAFLE